ncbi:MAG: T9SS type A sorting domain-containing protein, partial [candidate division WOR-3 bacterium]|nr:T9SS type A sorting domain-containing protein [candidate division WOR-3 bacterium]
GYPVGVAVSNQYAYVITTSPTNNLLVISIADTLAPVIVNTIALSYGPRALYAKDPYLFISYYYYGIEAFDISNPSSPVSLDRYNTTGNSFGMYVDQSKYIYLADGHSLVMLHMTPSGISETKKPIPNPTIFCHKVLSLTPEYKGSFRIMDVIGRQVKKAVLTSAKAIDVSELSAGIYYICLEQTEPKRFIKVK